MRQIAGPVFIIAFLLGQAGSAHAAPLYTQVADFPGGYASQNAPNLFGPQYTAFDDFTFAKGASIAGVQWQGAYSNLPTQGDIAQFQLTFWSNNDGLPGSVLKTYVIPGNAGEQFVASQSGFLDYSYGVILPTSFSAAANTTYWLSIQPTADYPPQWLWRSGSNGDGLSAQINLAVSAGPQMASGDLAFTLTGNFVPEPSTLALGIATLIALGARHLRDRSSTRPRS